MGYVSDDEIDLQLKELEVFPRTGAENAQRVLKKLKAERQYLRKIALEAANQISLHSAEGFRAYDDVHVYLKFAEHDAEDFRRRVGKSVPGPDSKERPSSDRQGGPDLPIQPTAQSSSGD